MNNINHSFDPLTYVKKLKQAGFTEQQAEVQARELAQLVYKKLVTKDDLKAALQSLEASLRQDMKMLETDLKQSMKALEVDLRGDIKIVESKLLFKLSSVIIVLNGGLFAGMATLLTKMLAH
jgi:polyhydroxyalkanoate synthesis regulator protein